MFDEENKKNKGGKIMYSIYGEHTNGERNKIKRRKRRTYRDDEAGTETSWERQ